MARPTISEVFGQGTVWSASPFPGTPATLTIPESALFGPGGYVGADAPDAQYLMILLMQNASQQLNEANRNNNATGIQLTITYGEFDAIIDPPGSTNLFRRDVWSAIAYQPQAFTPFDPIDISGSGGGGNGGGNGGSGGS